MPSMVLTLAEKNLFPKVIGIDGNTPIFLKVLTIDGIDGFSNSVISVISVRGIGGFKVANCDLKFRGESPYTKLCF